MIPSHGTRFVIGNIIGSKNVFVVFCLLFRLVVVVGTSSQKKTLLVIKKVDVNGLKLHRL